MRGQAQYLLRLNEALRRTVTERWARTAPKWTQFDGLVRVTDRTRAALAAQRLATRQYSVSALQRFAACPYQFLLGGILRLRAAEQPEPLQRLDPLTKGSIVHKIQAVTMRALAEQQRLPVTRGVAARGDGDAGSVHRARSPTSIASCWSRPSNACGGRRSRRSRGTCAAGCGTSRPTRRGSHAISSWRSGWRPIPDRDPRSVPDPVLVDGRFPLRGAIDAIDVHRQTGVLRVTDHKTGKDRTKDTLVIGGGSVLQPLVYAAVAEAMLGVPVGESRLFFCTSAAGFKQRPVLLDAGREAAGDRGARDDRPRGRARRAGAGAGRGRVRLVRVPAGVRPRRGAARGAEAAGVPGRTCVAEEPAMTPAGGRRGDASGSRRRSTRRSSSRRRPAPARPRRWSQRMVRVLATGRAR